MFEVTLFSEMLSAGRADCSIGGQPLVVTVDVRSEEESLRLTAQKIEPLDARRRAGRRRPAGLRRRGPRALEPEERDRSRSERPRRVTIVLDLPCREVEIAIPGGFKVDLEPAPRSSRSPASSTSTRSDG